MHSIGRNRRLNPPPDVDDSRNEKLLTPCFKTPLVLDRRCGTSRAALPLRRWAGPPNADLSAASRVLAALIYPCYAPVRPPAHFSPVAILGRCQQAILVVSDWRCAPQPSAWQSQFQELTQTLTINTKAACSHAIKLECGQPIAVRVACGLACGMVMGE